MAHFLYKPHVVGPEDKITTPDIMIDRACLIAGKEFRYLPVQRLGSYVELHVFSGKLDVTPAYAVVAAGGGALLSPAVLIHGSNEPMDRAEILVARSAWRLRNLAGHFGSLQLSVAAGGTRRDDVSLSHLAQPAAFMSRSTDGDLALPRGIIALCAAPCATIVVEARAAITVRLQDPTLERAMVHAVELVSVTADRWDERPLPRYTVGPVGEVQHYI